MTTAEHRMPLKDAVAKTLGEFNVALDPGIVDEFCDELLARGYEIVPAETPTNWLDVPCGYCGASTGQECVGPEGTAPARQTHSTRVALAAEHDAGLKPDADVA